MLSCAFSQTNMSHDLFFKALFVVILFTIILLEIWLFKVARLDFLGAIPLKFEHELRHH